MWNVRLRRLECCQYHGVVSYGWSVRRHRVSDLSVWISRTSSVLCTWSDPRKRSETLVSMNRLNPPPFFFSTPPTYLWCCISGISCSLSEWADWIDMFSLHDPFHTNTHLCSQTALRGPFSPLVAYFALNVFTETCNLLLRCVAEVNQSELGSGLPPSPFNHTLLLKKSVGLKKKKYWQAPWRCD